MTDSDTPLKGARGGRFDKRRAGSSAPGAAPRAGPDGGTVFARRGPASLSWAVWAVVAVVVAVALGMLFRPSTPSVTSAAAPPATRASAAQAPLPPESPPAPAQAAPEARGTPARTAGALPAPAPAGSKPYQLPPVLVNDLTDASAATLKEAAARGDADAAYQLFTLLDQCAGLPAFVDARQQSVQQGEPPAQRRRIEQKIAQLTPRCEGVSDADIGTRIKVLDDAAMGGSDYARMNYERALDILLQDRQALLRDPEELARLKGNAIYYLGLSAQTGNVGSMFRLAQIYDSGVLAQRNPELAYAYILAAANTGVSPAYGRLAEQWATSLSDEQRARAAEVAARLPH